MTSDITGPHDAEQGLTRPTENVHASDEGAVQLSQQDSSEETTEEEKNPYVNQEQATVDLDTPLESLFFYSMFIGALVTIVFLVAHFKEDLVPMELPLSVLWCSLGLFFIALILYTNTDNYYILDFVKKELRYHFTFFTMKKEDTVALFEEIQLTTTTAKQHRSRYHAIYYEYCAILITTDHKMIQISDYIKDSAGLNAANLRAKNIAEAIGVEFVEGQSGSYAELSGDGKGETMVTMRPHSPSWLPFFVFVVLILIGCLLIFL